MLCQNCQEREATVRAVKMGEGFSRSRDLCKECFEAELSPEILKRIREHTPGSGAISGWTGYNPEVE
jgi:protein-arginine kinase activator protein McsA